MSHFSPMGSSSSVLGKSYFDGFLKKSVRSPYGLADDTILAKLSSLRCWIFLSTERAWG